MTTEENLRTILEAIGEMEAALPLARELGADTAYLEFLLARMRESASPVNAEGAPGTP